MSFHDQLCLFDKIIYELICRDKGKGTSTLMIKPEDLEEDAIKDGKSPIATVQGEVTNSHNSCSYSRSLSHISESSADGIVPIDKCSCEIGDVTSLVSGISIYGMNLEMPNRTTEPLSSVATDTDMSLRRPEIITEHIRSPDVTAQHSNKEQQDASRWVRSPCTLWKERVDLDSLPLLEGKTVLESTDGTYVARRVSVEEKTSDRLCIEGDGLEDALGDVVSTLDDYRGQFPELQLLEQELKLLQATLKVRKQTSQQVTLIF